VFKRRAIAALPYGGETTPLLLPIDGIYRTMTGGAVHLIIKQVFDNAIGHLESTAEAHERATERLRQASAHWLRHTTGSRMIDGQVDLRYVRDNLGHESISTTSQILARGRRRSSLCNKGRTETQLVAR